MLIYCGILPYVATLVGTSLEYGVVLAKCCSIGLVRRGVEDHVGVGISKSQLS